MVSALCVRVAAAAIPPTLELNAAQRSTGSRRDVAVTLARSVLPLGVPAQILHVRVDGAGKHLVAGLMLEGRGRTAFTQDAFENEVAALATRSLSRSPIDEVDIWAVVPIAVPPNAVVSGFMAQPTSRTVFSAFFRQGDRARIAQKLRAREGVYWEPQWVSTLGAKAHASRSPNPDALSAHAGAPVVS